MANGSSNSPVTDPELLRQLEGGPSPVTDPALLSKLDGKESPIERSLNVAREAPAAFGRNMLSAGFKGLMDSLGPSKASREVLGIPDNPLIDRITQSLAYKPKYQETQQGLDIIGTPGRLYGQMAGAAGRKAEDVTGSPMAGEMVRKSIEIAPYGLGRMPATPDVNAASAARAAGFKLTPLEKGAGGPISRTTATVAGEPRLARLISQKNVEVVNAKIAEDLGLPPDVPITKDALRTVERSAGKAYEAIRGTGTIAADQNYLADLISIRDKFAPAARELGGNKAIYSDLKGIAEQQFSSAAAVDRIRQLRESGRAAFNAGKGSEGSAYRAMADALENQVGRHLQVTGQADLLANYQAARTTIAKVKMAEDALNEVTGSLKAGVYGRAAAEGKPLTGGAAEVGKAAAAFPRSFQSPSTYLGTGPAFGDLALGAASRVANPASLVEPLVSLGSRPMLRGLLASNAGQSLAGASLLPPIAYGLAPGLLSVEDPERSRR